MSSLGAIAVDEPSLVPELAERVRAALIRTGLLLERVPVLEDDSIDRLEQALSHALGLVQQEFAALPAERRPTHHTVAVCEVALELQGLLEALRAHRHELRTASLVRVKQALSRMRGVDRVSVALDRATEEICKSVGFDRSILFRLRGNEMYAESIWFSQEPEWAQEILELAQRNPPQLTHLIVEAEAMRQRAPIIIHDAADDERTFKPLTDPLKTRSYVAAPIMPSGRVIGFIHADRYFQGRDVDELDRDLLSIFAEGFGYAVERTVLLERLRSQRLQISQLMAATEAVMREVCEAEIELQRGDGDSADLAQAAASLFVAPDHRIASLLTAREREVLDLLAEGATNAQIAGRLVISEGTVKSHVKHVLRKLRVANRAEAVARYLRIANR